MTTLDCKVHFLAQQKNNTLATITEGLLYRKEKMMAKGGKTVFIVCITSMSTENANHVPPP